jgi:hypothetical protein
VRHRSRSPEPPSGVTARKRKAGPAPTLRPELFNERTHTPPGVVHILDGKQFARRPCPSEKDTGVRYTDNPSPAQLVHLPLADQAKPWRR